MYTPQILTRRDKDGNAHYIRITRQAADDGLYVGYIWSRSGGRHSTSFGSTPHGAADAVIEVYNAKVATGVATSAFAKPTAWREYWDSDDRWNESN